MGVVGRRNWEAKRRTRVQRGVGGQVYVGMLLRGSVRRGGGNTHKVRSYHATIDLLIVIIQQFPFPVSLLKSYLYFFRS